MKVTLTIGYSLILALISPFDIWFCQAEAGQQRLFGISKNTNNNIVCFDASVDITGSLDREKPIKCYWLVEGQEPGKPLNWLESKAYRFALTPDTGGTFRLVFNRLPERVIYLVNKSGQYKAKTLVNGVMLRLERIHLVFKDGLITQPIEKLEYYGKLAVSESDSSDVCQTNILSKK